MCMHLYGYAYVYDDPGTYPCKFSVHPGRCRVSMSYSLNSLKRVISGVIYGSSIGFMKVGARSLGYGSYDFRSLSILITPVSHIVTPVIPLTNQITNDLLCGGYGFHHGTQFFDVQIKDPESGSCPS